MAVAKEAMPFEGSHGPGKTTRLHDGVAYSLSNEAATDFDDAIASLTDGARLREHFSDSYIRRRIDVLFASLLTGGSEKIASDGVKALIDEHSAFDDENEVFLPVQGITLASSPLVLGNISLRVVDETTISSIVSRATEVVKGSTETEENKARQIADIEARVREHLGTRVVSEYHTVAEPQRAREKAVEETRRALELLRLCIPVVSKRDMSVQIGLPGEVARGVRNYVSYSSQTFTWGFGASGAIGVLDVDDRTLAALEALGVPRLSDILRRADSSATSFEITLLNAVHWFSAAQMQVEPENAFLALVTCLEALLTPRDGNPIGTAIGEGIALLLGGNVDARLARKQRFKKLYAKRSAVSHGGAKAILDSDLLELEELALSVLVTLVGRHKDFASQKDLLEWIERTKLGGGTTDPSATA